MSSLEADVQSGLDRFATVRHRWTGEEYYAFETDGWGNHTAGALDDANMPNLLWLPYLKGGELSPPQHKLYKSTRAKILSKSNPNFFTSRKGRGLGSQHTTRGLRNDFPGEECTMDCVWPLGLVMEGLTSERKDEADACLQLLVSTSRHGLLHEGFNMSEPDMYNRDWFGWANGLFATWVVSKYA